MPQTQTLEKYFRDADASGAIDHSVRARVGADGAVTFYIHPSGRDGQTLDFVVGGNSVSCVNTCGTPAPSIWPAHLG